MKWFLLSSLVVLAGCGDASPAASSTTSEAATSQSGDDLRLHWARYVHTTVAPRLLRLPPGVRPSEETIKNVVIWGMGEGVYTISGNHGYGQPGGRQNPLSFSNCLDDSGINSRTAFPDCPSIRSGNWQVGIAGLQVGEYLSRLPGLYRTLYGDMPPRLLAANILPWLGEPASSFTDISVDELAYPSNAKLASVILRDPAIGILAMTSHPWMVNGIPNSYPFDRRYDIVNQAWSETPPGAFEAPNGKWVVDGMSRAFFAGPTPYDGGNPFFACSAASLDPCLATFGWPTGGMVGSASGTLQRFERAEMRLSDGRVSFDNLVANAHPERVANPSRGAIDDAFRGYFESYGGLEVFGWPLGPARTEGDLVVQSFERVELARKPGESFDPNAHDPVWQVSRSAP